MSMNAKNSNAANNYAACTQYRAALEDAAASARLLAIAEPSPDPGAGFSRMVMARIRQELQSSEGKSIWRPFVSVGWRFAVTASFALVLLVAFELVRDSQ